MEKQNTFSSNFLKVSIGFAVIYGVVYLAKAGYALGQWFHQLGN